MADKKTDPKTEATTEAEAPKRMVVLLPFANHTELKRRVEIGEEITVSWGLAARLRKLGFARNK